MFLLVGLLPVLTLCAGMALFWALTPAQQRVEVQAGPVTVTPRIEAILPQGAVQTTVQTQPAQVYESIREKIVPVPMGEWREREKAPASGGVVPSAGHVVPLPDSGAGAGSAGAGSAGTGVSGKKAVLPGATPVPREMLKPPDEYGTELPPPKDTGGRK